LKGTPPSEAHKAVRKSGERIHPRLELPRFSPPKTTLFGGVGDNAPGAVAKSVADVPESPQAIAANRTISPTDKGKKNPELSLRV
jgi:hypothetical protein